jgi:hypothetical protein
MDKFKLTIKEIYDYVQLSSIQSFRCVALDYPSKTRLVDFQKGCTSEPILCILLDGKIKSSSNEQLDLRKRFPWTEVRIEI